MDVVIACGRDVRMGPGQSSGKRSETSRLIRGGRLLDSAALTFLDPDHSEDENRSITIGRSAQQRVLFVAHTEREDRIRIISARRATPREQRQYEEGFE